MRTTLPLCAVILFTQVSSAFSQGPETPTALGALKLIPRSEARNIARIEAREGKPSPDSWHLLVHDSREDTGVHEFVIAGDEIVASRALSQFADSLSDDDVIGTEVIKVDSDRAAKIAQQYALANGIPVSGMNYQLFREGAGAAPIWKIGCLDEKGQTIGTIVLTASKGTVVSHDGFPIEPNGTPEKLTVQASGEVGGPATASAVSPADLPATEEPPAEPVFTKKPSSRTKKRAETESDETEPPRKGFFHRAGGKLQKFFTGRDTLSR